MYYINLVICIKLIDSNCVNIYDFMHICVLVHVMSGGWAVGWKSYVYHLFLQNKHFFIWHFHSACHVRSADIDVVFLICESVWFPNNSPISCLDNVFTFLYIIIVNPCLIWYILYMFQSIALWIVFSSLFNMYALAVIIIVISGLVGLWLWTIFNMVQDGT